MKTFLIIFSLFLNTALAEEENKKNPYLGFALTESILLLYSGLLADEPKELSEPMSALFLIFGTKEEILAFAPFAYYNITVDTKKVSKSEIFRNNFIGMNLVLASAYWFDYFERKKPELQKFNLHMNANTDLMLTYNYKW